MFRDEWDKGSQGSNHCEENSEQRVQRGLCVFMAQSRSSLETASVEANVPVGQVVDALQQLGHHGVESVALGTLASHMISCRCSTKLTFHLLFNKLEQCLAVC